MTLRNRHAPPLPARRLPFLIAVFSAIVTLDLRRATGGAARVVEGHENAYELCGASPGYGDESRDDYGGSSLRFLYRELPAARAHSYGLTVRVDKVSAGGIAGLDVRFSTFGFEDSPDWHFRTTVRPKDMSLELETGWASVSYHSFHEGDLETTPLDAELPIWLRIRQDDAALTAFYSSDGVSWISHGQMFATGRPIQNGPKAPGSARRQSPDDLAQLPRRLRPRHARLRRRRILVLKDRLEISALSPSEASASNPPPALGAFDTDRSSDRQESLRACAADSPSSSWHEADC